MFVGLFVGLLVVDDDDDDVVDVVVEFPSQSQILNGKEPTEATYCQSLPASPRWVPLVSHFRPNELKRAEYKRNPLPASPPESARFINPDQPSVRVPVLDVSAKKAPGCQINWAAKPSPHPTGEQNSVQLHEQTGK